MNATEVARLDDLDDRTPAYALVNGVDLVVTRYDDQVSVLYGRCLHRGALMADGRVEGHNLICGVHGWDYRLDTGVSEYNNDEALHPFESWVEDGVVFVDGDQVDAWNCPVGIATQQDHLRARLQIGASARRLANWFEATVELMSVLARATGHERLDDLTTFDRDLAYLSGVPHGGAVPLWTRSP